MHLQELIGSSISNIYVVHKMELGGMDMAECFIELDNKIRIDIPYGGSEEIWIKELNKEAICLFADLEDYPVYLVNPEQKASVFNKLRSLLPGHKKAFKEYEPYKVEYKKNKLKHIKDRKIADILWYDEPGEKGYLVLDNGYLISETTHAMHGTGLAGLSIYGSLQELTLVKGKDYYKLSSTFIL